MSEDSSGSRPKTRLTRRRFFRAATIGAAAITLAACTAPPTPAPTSAPTTAPTSPPPKPAAPTPAPAKAVATTAPKAPPVAPATQAPPPKPARVKVTLAQSTHTISQAPIDVAQLKGFFDAEAIELEHQQLSSGATVSTALVNNEVQFGEFGSSDVVAANEKGLDFLAVSQVAGSLTMTFGIRREYAAAKGVTPQSPLAQRVAALKGARFGLSSPAGAPTQYTKYILKLYGLDPEKDVEMSVVGFGPARRAALQNNQVDIFLGGVPDAEVTEFEGYGLVYIRPAEEIPIFKDFAWEIVATRKEYAEKNASVVERVARAIGRANNFIQASPAEVKRLLKTPFPEIDDKVISLAIDNLTGAYKPDGKMTETEWKNAAQVMFDVGAIKAMPNTAEHGFWTNRYIKDVPKR